MRIIVCIKQICHYIDRTGTDPEQQYFADVDRINRINPYDEAAFGLALRIKNEVETCEIVIVTLGPLIAEKQLKWCFALGGDHLVNIECNENVEQLDPWRKSVYLAKAINELKGDLVLCGKESLDRRNGQVGAYLAQQLKVPFISGISQLIIEKETETTKLIRKAGRGTREVWSCQLPGVFTVDLGAEAPSLPTLKQRYAADEFPMQTLYFTDENPDPKTICSGSFPPCPRTKNINAPDSQLSSFERVNGLLSGSRIEKKSEMLTGNAKEQVKGIVTFLKENGIV